MFINPIATLPPSDPAPIVAGMSVLTIGIVLAAYGFYALRLSKTKIVDQGNVYLTHLECRQR